jgi:hypothetical protein
MGPDIHDFKIDHALGSVTLPFLYFFSPRVVAGRSRNLFLFNLKLFKSTVMI